jgi:hypothetical protein
MAAAAGRFDGTRSGGLFLVYDALKREVHTGPERRNREDTDPSNGGQIRPKAGWATKESRMMLHSRKSLVATMVALIAGSAALMPFAAHASENGRKNTTLALGAVTAYLLSQKQWIPAAIAGAGTYAAYHNWQAEIDARNRNQRSYYRYDRSNYRRPNIHIRQSRPYRDSYNNRRYNDQYNDRYNNNNNHNYDNDYNRYNQGDGDYDDNGSPSYHHDNGRHLGWYKQHGNNGHGHGRHGHGDD